MRLTWLNAPRLAWKKQKVWRKHQNTVYWVDIKLALKKGFKFYQTRSNVIILYDTLPAFCIPKVVVKKISKNCTRDNICHLGLLQRFPSRSCWTQQRLPTNPTKTQNPIIKNGETHGWATVHPGDRKRCLVWSLKTPKTQQGRRDLRTNQNPSSVCSNFVDKYEEEDEDLDADQARTGDPWVDNRSLARGNRHWLQVYGLPHAIVKEAENFRVQELVKKIESHPHRRTLQADWKQNNTYKLFSEESKVMIRDMGNIELFKLCETIPKLQCS